MHNLHIEVLDSNFCCVREEERSIVRAAMHASMYCLLYVYWWMQISILCACRLGDGRTWQCDGWETATSNITSYHPLRFCVIDVAVSNFMAHMDLWSVSAQIRCLKICYGQIRHPPHCAILLVCRFKNQLVHCCRGVQYTCLNSICESVSYIIHVQTMECVAFCVPTSTVILSPLDRCVFTSWQHVNNRRMKLLLLLIANTGFPAKWSVVRRHFAELEL